MNIYKSPILIIGFFLLLLDFNINTYMYGTSKTHSYYRNRKGD
jgi:hypothetical protein